MFTTYMNEALAEATKALERGEIPVGAVVVGSSGNIIARAGNETRSRLDPVSYTHLTLPTIVSV